MHIRTIVFLGANGLAAGCSSSQATGDASVADGGDASNVTSDASATDAGDAVAQDAPASDSVAADPLSEQALWNRIDAKACDTTQFTSDSGAVAISDAASYFLGTFKKGADGTWAGREYWLLYATPDWLKNKGKDCRVVWDATVTETTTSTCAACDKALTVKAALNASETTCAAELYKGQETYTVTYEVDVAADGAGQFFFSKSKKTLGAGYFKSDSIGYLSAHQCLYF